MCVAFKFNLINRLIYKKWPYPKLFLSFILDLNLKSFQLPGPLKLEKLMMAFTPWRLPRHCDLSFDLSCYDLSLRFGPGLPNVYPSSRLRGQDIRPRSSLLPQLNLTTLQCGTIGIESYCGYGCINGCFDRLSSFIPSAVISGMYRTDCFDRMIPTFMLCGKLFIEKLKDSLQVEYIITLSLYSRMYKEKWQWIQVQFCCKGNAKCQRFSAHLLFQVDISG